MRAAACLLLSTVLLSSFAADAQTPLAPPAYPNETGSGPRFDAAKQKHLAHLEQITNCVRQSQTFEAMRACHPPHRH